MLYPISGMPPFWWRFPSGKPWGFGDLQSNGMPRCGCGVLSDGQTVKTHPARGCGLSARRLHPRSKPVPKKETKGSEND